MKGFTGEPVVVLGFGVAAVSAICALRENGYNGLLTVVTDAGPEPYSPVLTSYYAGGRIDRDRCFPWADLDIAGKVDALFAHARVTALDVAKHEIKLADGQRIGYSKLLVATGAHPVSPGFPVTQAYRPHVLRTMEDAERLRSALTAKSRLRVLVSGTSMVGLKVLEACLDRGADVTLVGRSAHIMRATAHPLIAESFERLLVERGVSLRLSQTVEQVDDAFQTGGCAVRFDNGGVERFDEVVLAQGVAPNLDFIDQGALEMRDGLVVDRFMRTSAPDVFAAGDVAQALDLASGRNRIIGLWHNAVQQGRCAGAAIAAELAGRASLRPYPGSISANTIHVRDILFASAGSIAEGPRRRVDVIKGRGRVSAFAYESRAGVDQLVGFNVLAVASQDGIYDELVDEIGAYRRAILNSYL